MSARSSYWAARWSLDVLLGRTPEPGVEINLFNPAPVPVSSCYLWTLTTPDVCDPSAVLKRWRNATRNWKDLKCLRVLEEHPGGHGWHIHFVTPIRYDVNRVRKLTSRHGFGRIHVKEIPAEKAYYLVKYLVKALRRSTGRRLWACVGFQGFVANDIVIKDSFWSEVYSTPCPSGYSLGARRKLGLLRIKRKMHAREPGEPYYMESEAVLRDNACWLWERPRHE